MASPREIPVSRKPRRGKFSEAFAKVFLGPNATFRNANRNWIYLVFLAFFLIALVTAGVLREAAGP